MNEHCQEGGRSNQKRRTRAAITRAAAELLDAGETPTIPDAADAAGVSRATAYRYFSSQEALLLEVLLEATTPVVDERIQALHEYDDVYVRVEAVVRSVLEMVLANEPAFRAMLRASLDPDHERSTRGGRRIGWFERALEPIRAELSEPAFNRLVAALSVFSGIETVIVMHDIIDVDPQEAIAIAEWAARTLVDGALRMESGELAEP